MNVRKIAGMFGCGFVAMCLLMMVGGAVMAQPLVTGDLSVYYSFNSFVDEVPDESGADPPLNGDVYGVVGQIDDAKRGAGSAFIFSEPAFNPEHFIAIGGCDGIENPEACDALPPDRVPSTGFTIATWAKLQSTGGDQSIFQAQSGDGSFVVHAQAQNDGQLRLHLRGQAQSENIIGVRTGQWTEEEWFHYAITYDQPNDVWGLFFNGQAIAGGPSELNVPLGDWGQGALIGIVPDRARQAFGQFDDYYIFTRALSPEEIEECLFALVDCTGETTPWPGDANGDRHTDVADLNIIGTNWQMSGKTREQGDLNGDGDVNVSDLNILGVNWQTWDPEAPMPAAVPEPSSVALLLAGLLGLFTVRRRSSS